eukprot:CAMPEP_0168175332 /NCGR_PEP_ID=MMETSP0139_2-20121125/7058_1 /TAXON_ID=44445 /ORGANISM="Pseudo-nitzschia australis, Strain 10249 10 AB" /LENGTH=1010 /DNA_ID=CAMNT_0008093697 /DNA_START=102 /DNA_END=3134 /DNA_ORIENTATION=-
MVKRSKTRKKGRKLTRETVNSLSSFTADDQDQEMEGLIRDEYSDDDHDDEYEYGEDDDYYHNQRVRAQSRKKAGSSSRNGSNGNGSTNNNTNNANGTIRRTRSAAMWKTLAFVMFGLAVLFATDVIEFNQLTNNNSNGSTRDFGNLVKGWFQGSTTNSGGDSSSSSSSTSSSSTSQLTKSSSGSGSHDLLVGNVQQKPPTEAPVPPPTNPPTEAPVEAPTNPPTEAAPAPTEAPKEEAVTATEAPKAEAKSAATSSTATASSHTYKPRGKPMSDADRNAMEDKWGKWTLEPPVSKVLPSDDADSVDDYYAAYPNRDVPRKEFPAGAWQTDKDWLSKFLPEGIQLVERAMNAILEEYGQPNLGNDGTTTSDLFRVGKLDDHFPGDVSKEPCKSSSGCTDKTSFYNLKRRLLHAVMTEDVFAVAMGGHSSAAGHGNHFIQSYTLQVQWILEGVFSRLGVRHQSRNFGLGGLGTTQSGLATKQIFGHDIDVLLWDAGMTEGEQKARDMFFRQGILGPGKVPVIGSLSPRNDVLRFLNDNVGADWVMIGDQGNVQLTETLEDLQKLPWASHYVRCGVELSGICRDNEYMGVCWIDRDDYKPTTPQKPAPGGRAKWHPGNRKHQIVGRAIAYIILEALREGLVEWNAATDYALDDKAWHLTALYDNTRAKLEALDPKFGTCNQYKDDFSQFMCHNAVQARTEFTPRAHPDHTNIRTLMPPGQAEHINDPPVTVYEAPDVFNKNLHPPDGAVDVLSIIEAGIPYAPVRVPDYTTAFYPKPTFETKPPTTLPVGKGFHLATAAGFCDGSVDSWCNKADGHDCLLYGHNDGRHGILMNSYCGWMVTNLPAVKHGFIVVKAECWHPAGSNPKTSTWNSINNERRELFTERGDVPFLRSKSLSSSDSNRSAATTAYDYRDDGVGFGNEEEDEQERRNLKFKVPDYCDDFKFEFALDGKVTSWNKDQFAEHKFDMQRVVEMIKISDDPKLTDGAEKEVEVAFRMTGCANDKHFAITHIYWA